jgi:hypothetical protein
MIKYGIVIFFAIFLPVYAIAQSNIYLQHQIKSNRQKKISINRDYTFHTADTIYYRTQILSWTESTLMIAANVQSDTIVLSIENIQYLEKHSKYAVFEITAYLGAILLSVTPVVWAFEGGQAAIGTLQGVGVLAAFSVPGLLLKRVGRKKDTKNKWSICTE